MNKNVIMILVVIFLALFILIEPTKDNSLEVTDYDADGNVLQHSVITLKGGNDLMQSMVNGNGDLIKKRLPAVPKGASTRKLKIIIINTGNIPAEFSLRKGVFKADFGYQKKSK